jgi:hypothetical protein
MQKIFCSVVNEFEGDDASSVTVLQDIFQDSNELKVLRTDLAYIRENFSFLSQSVTKLEITKNLLSETIKEINDIQDKHKNINGSKTDAVKPKFRSCIRKNKWFKSCATFHAYYRGEDQADFDELKDLNVGDIECYKYA